jgi:hypothetical protein
VGQSPQLPLFAGREPAHKVCQSVCPPVVVHQIAQYGRSRNGITLSGLSIQAACGIAAANTSSTTSGLLAITSSSTRAAASG